VRWLGYVAEGDLPALYAGATAFVFPSLYEGFGLPVVEAMAWGTPVITSSVSSLPEVAGDAAVLVDPYDVDGLARAMQRLLDDACLRDSLIAAGRQRARRFTWERCAEDVEAVFDEAMEKSGPRTPDSERGSGGF
jgi:glycosyltransferase involved in cell wall biosynthesis